MSPLVDSTSSREYMYFLLVTTTIFEDKLSWPKSLLIIKFGLKKNYEFGFGTVLGEQL